MVAPPLFSLEASLDGGGGKNLIPGTAARPEAPCSSGRKASRVGVKRDSAALFICIPITESKAIGK